MKSFLAILLIFLGLRGVVEPNLVKYVVQNVKDSDLVKIMENFEEEDLTPRILLTVRTSKDLIDRGNLPGLKEWIADKIKTDYDMNVKAAFKLLGNVGDLLRVSYAGCKGYTCSVAVANVNSQYQDMIYASHRTSGFFVKSVLRALKYHKFAEKAVQDNKLPRALKWITKCANIADKLVVSSKKMVAQSDAIKNLTVNAFMETMRNDLTNSDEIRQARERYNRLQARISGINKMVENLLKRERELGQLAKTASSAAKEWEEKYDKEANKELKTKKLCSVTKLSKGNILGSSLGEKVVTTCYGTELDKGAISQQKTILSTYEKQIKAQREKQLEYLKLKSAGVMNLTLLYGELAKSMEGLKFTKDASSDLQRARNSLQIAIQTLAIVKTIFLNTVNFWMKVTENAEDQGSTSDSSTILQELGIDEMDEFEQILIESGVNWIAMGIVTNQAKIAMVEVRKRVNEAFVNLPSHDQAKLLLESSQPIIDETKALLNQLSMRSNSTANEIAATEKAINIDKSAAPA